PGVLMTIGHDIITVEVAYAQPAQQMILALRVRKGTTAETAIIDSGILEQFPEIDLAINKIGVFGKSVKVDYVLRHMDRIEIYRPLIADPKEVRRQRVAAEKSSTGKK